MRFMHVNEPLSYGDASGKILTVRVLISLICSNVYVSTMASENVEMDGEESSLWS